MEQQEQLRPAHASGPFEVKSPYRRSLARKFLQLGPKETLLYVGELRALFTEISMFGEDVDAWFKQSSDGRLEPVENLSRLYSQLKNGEIFGGQVVYQWRGQERADTLIVRPQGVVCVRSESPIDGSPKHLAPDQ